VLSASACRGRVEELATPESLACGGKSIALPGGADSGFRQCADGAVERAQGVACSTAIGGPACTGSEPAQYLSCTSDADCSAHPHGRCLHLDGAFGPTHLESGCSCAFACAGDAECASDEACLCAGVDPSGPTHSSCVSATCRSGADCASGACGLYSYGDFCDVTLGLACRSANDACRSGADCAFGEDCVGADPWHCAPVVPCPI
jgi:hypothetical protein